MSAKDIPVFVVDDDGAFVDSLQHLLESHGWQTKAFFDADDFFSRGAERIGPAVVLVDVRMPGKSGFDVLAELQSEPELAVVMMTGHGDVPLAVRAIQHGALEFIEKPFCEEKLLRALNTAFEELDARLRTLATEQTQKSRLAQLTPRENTVLKLMSEGHGSREIAQRLNLSTRTVEMHRRNLVLRLNLRTTAEALALYLEAGARST